MGREIGCDCLSASRIAADLRRLRYGRQSSTATQRSPLVRAYYSDKQSGLDKWSGLTGTSMAANFRVRITHYSTLTLISFSTG